MTMPYTRMVGAPLVITVDPCLTTIENAVLFAVGVVENVKVAPPFDVVSAVVLLVDTAEKSLTTPVVGPLLSDTEMVHVIAVPTRSGDAATHANVLAVVGFPNATKLSDPPEIETPPTLTAMAKAVVMLAGVVENVNVAPPSDVVGVIDPVAVVVTAKSEATPVVAAPLLETVMVHEIKVPMRSGLGILQESVEAVVGLP